MARSLTRPEQLKVMNVTNAGFVLSPILFSDPGYSGTVLLPPGEQARIETANEMSMAEVLPGGSMIVFLSLPSTRPLPGATVSDSTAHSHNAILGVPVARQADILEKVTGLAASVLSLSLERLRVRSEF